MEFTAAAKTDLLARLDADRAFVETLEPTPAVNPLQAQLTAALARVESLEARLVQIHNLSAP